MSDIFTEYEICESCKGKFPKLKNGPVHPYMDSSPGCWALYGEVLSREYSERSFFEKDYIHKLTVDTYAAQHPGRESRQSINSVGYHLIRLCLILDKKISVEDTQKVMVLITQQKKNFFWLQPPKNLGEVSVINVYNAITVEKHKEIVQKWAESVWGSWHAHHATIKNWINLLSKI